MWPNPQETEEILNGKLHFSCSIRAQSNIYDEAFTKIVNVYFFRKNSSLNVWLTGFWLHLCNPLSFAILENFILLPSWINFFSNNNKLNKLFPQLAFTFSKLTIETLEQGVKYVQS